MSGSQVEPKYRKPTPVPADVLSSTNSRRPPVTVSHSPVYGSVMFASIAMYMSTRLRSATSDRSGLQTDMLAVGVEPVFWPERTGIVVVSSAPSPACGGPSDGSLLMAASMPPSHCASELSPGGLVCPFVVE